MSGRVVDIDVNPSDPTEFYVAYATGGVWHTINNGQSFKPIFDSTATLNIGDKISIPISMNFASMATNFAGPYAGLKNQTIGQFLTNPANNFS